MWTVCSSCAHTPRVPRWPRRECCSAAGSGFGADRHAETEHSAQNLSAPPHRLAGSREWLLLILMRLWLLCLLIALVWHCYLLCLRHHLLLSRRWWLWMWRWIVVVGVCWLLLSHSTTRSCMPESENISISFVE